MFSKLLIANRGEIACRIARTARRLGVATVAVYSEVDANALHVACADEAWPIGPAPASESYLDMDRIIDVARRAGAEAVHPGYGFLAENAEFAARCVRSGLAFVGPSAEAMRLMGAKASAKTLMEQAGVPTVPGYHAGSADDASLAIAAARVGFPVLVKASAGGGGRGMRVVRAASDFAEAVAAARREARAAFGDDRLLIEKYLERPRHIEMQIFADCQGGSVVFPARDCSMQRHHQKILEETPAPGLSAELLDELASAALAAARAVDYVGAGTVEFLVADSAFYFLETNTRLQVEHPVTEMIAGVDLVEWQLRIACGERLPMTQQQLTTRGCAIEARICAEDPARDFLPAVGRIEHYRPPAETADVRVDTGVCLGDRITSYYDSLIAKLIVRGEDRPSAARQLQQALRRFEIAGVASNLDFLRALTDSGAFLAGRYDTGFVAREAEALSAAADPDMALLLAAAAAARLDRLREIDRERAGAANDPFSPWAAGDAWRLHARGAHAFLFDHDAETHRVRVSPRDDGGFHIEAAGRDAVVSATRDGDRMRLRIDGVEKEIGVVSIERSVFVIADGRSFHFSEIDRLSPPKATAMTDAQLSAPVPARVTRVLVKEGDHVGKGAPLVVLEAMKMEFTLTAPRAGVISSLRGVEGAMAREGEQLVALAEDAAA